MRLLFRQGVRGTIGIGLTIICSGCGLWQPTQQSRCLAEKKQVMSRVVSQERELDKLRSQNQQLAERLAEAEKQVAVLHDQSPSRLADGRRRVSSLESKPSGDTPRFQRESAKPNEWSARSRRGEEK